jgi:hypothetical protein
MSATRVALPKQRDSQNGHDLHKNASPATPLSARNLEFTENFVAAHSNVKNLHKILLLALMQSCMFDVSAIEKLRPGRHMALSLKPAANS